MPELSIIVPVYKVEKYLAKCIDSILRQTFTDFELILIDDGSPDRCGKICDEYAVRDSRIKVIHQENQGVSAARNAGLDIATGVYLGFVDSDDWIETDMYEMMITTAKRKAVDIVVCGVNYCRDDGTFIRSDLMGNKIYSTQELLFSLYGTPNPIGGACWNKIFLRNKIMEVRFHDELSMAEDWVYLFETFKLCDDAYHISDTFYNVVERPGSATRADEVDAIYQIIFGGKLLLLLLLGRNYSRELECVATDKYLDDCIRYSNLLREAGKETRQFWQWKFFKIRLQMIKVLPRAYFRKLLPKNKIHGYIYEMIKL